MRSALAVTLCVQAGLHHHGEEASRAGYTVGELLLLARSSHARQVVLGLEVLALLLARLARGEMDAAFHQNLTEELLKAGLVHVLRVSLDSSTMGVVVAAAGCLSALLVCREEEEVQDWVPGVRQPSLAPCAPLPAPEEEVGDQALVEADTILGLVRMDLLERAAYLVGRVETEEAAVTSLLTVVTRVARHPAMAARVASHRLVTHLLAPLLSKHAQALKLVRVLCARSRRIAEGLLVSLRLGERLVVLVAMESSVAEEVAVCVEAHRLWGVLLAYGACVGVWGEVAPVAMARLVAEYRGEGVTRVATTLLEVAGRACLAGAPLDQLVGLEELLTSSVAKWLVREVEGEGRVAGAVRAAAACRALARLYRSQVDREEVQLAPLMERLEALHSSTLIPFLDSPLAASLLTSLEQGSGFLSGLRAATTAPPALPGLGLVLQGGALHPALSSPALVLLEGALELLATTRRLLTDLWRPPCALPPPHPALTSYLTHLTSASTLALNSHWLSRLESRLLHHLLPLYSSSLPTLLHPTALTLASLLHTGDSALLHNLFDNYIFSPSLLSTSSLSSRLSSLSLAPSSIPLVSGEAAPAPSLVLEESLAHLPSLRAAYSALLASTPRPTAPEERSTLTHPPDTLLPSDWPFLPLLSLPDSSPSSPTLSPQQVQWALAWLALLPPSPATPTFLRLSAILLAPSSLFLLPPVHSLLHLHLSSLLTRGGLDLSLPLPGVSSLDLYRDVLDQFVAESYGDKLFAVFAVVPAAMAQPVAYRRVLWLERRDVLELVTLAAAHTVPWGREWLQPLETDPQVLMAQFQAVVEGVVGRARQPLLHTIAATHVTAALGGDHQHLVGFRTFVREQFTKYPAMEQMFGT